PLGGLPGHPGGEVEQHLGAEALAHRVQRGGPHAVVGGYAHDVDLVDLAGAQPVGQRGAVLVGPLEPAVGGGVRALVEHGVDSAGQYRGREVRVEARALGAGHAVGGPGVHVVRVVGEVAARGDVVVAGGYDVPVSGRGLPDQLGDGGGHVGPAGHGEAAPLAEVVLHVDDDQGAAHGGCPSGGGRVEAARPVNHRA